MKHITENLMPPKNSIERLDSTHDNKVNILMVDDHQENILALEAVLQSLNYNLISANSGKEALKCMLKHEFAVILLDVQMPGLNGFETARLIKAREKTRHIPIIFITAINQDIEHVRQGYSAGAIDYIFKPFQPDTLRQKIEQFVKIQQTYKANEAQNELEHSARLSEINKQLDQTTLHLRRTEALAKVVEETIIDTILTFDVNGRILSVNAAVKKMFGYISEDLVGEHVVTLFSMQDSCKDLGVMNSMLSTLKSAVGKIIEVCALRKDKSHFPADVQMGETTVESQQIFVCTIRDVTERKQIEEVKKKQFLDMEHIVKERTSELLKANEKLQKEIEERNKIAEHLYLSQERFRKIFESSPCLMAIYSLEGETILDVNTSWVTNTGYRYEELVKKKNLKCFLEEGALNNPKEIIRNKKVTYKTKGGELRSGLFSTEMIDIHPEPCLLLVLTDITEQVHFEKELSRLDRLNLIGEMAAGIAHEIRNPMTTVHGFLQVTKNDRSKLPDEIVDLMIEELERANSIITEFLNLAKNKVSVKTKQNLNTIITSLAPLIQAEALRSGKHLILNLGESSIVLADQKEIRQLILNMALNGLDAMSAGGKLTIRTFEKKESVFLEIKDQGKGISPEVLDKIGTPFYTTKESGTGLGLAICYSVAERHNADIDISTGAFGTTFTVRFNKSL